MKIITTPMCEDVLRIAGLTDYTVVRPDEIKNADLAIILSETKSEVPKLAIKLNTYSQVYESITKISEKFNLNADADELNILEKYINENKNKREDRKDISVKVYSNFLKDTLVDMGFTICDTDYDYVICPDYLAENIKEEELIIIPSHKNVSTNIIERITERYAYLERELCTKH